LPLGVVVWWLTLLLARWAAGQERAMQARYHGVVFEPRAVFRTTERWEEREGEGEEEGVRGEQGFWRCSWAMVSQRAGYTYASVCDRQLTCTVPQFCDYYSYASLSYFLLIKPVVILFSTIAVVALFPVAFVLFPVFPIYLRGARAWGWYQARIAMENL
jgi:hypothetical protein